MSRFVKRIRPWMVYCVILVLALVPAFLTPVVRGQEGAPDAGEPAAVALSEESEACMACHSGDMEEAPTVNLAAHLKSPHAEQDCQSCHAEYTADYPHTAAMKISRVDCATCHDTEAFDTSVHARPDKLSGDHPTCASCHVGGTDPHAIKFVSTERSPEAWTRAEKTEACAECHSDTERMKRYGVDPDAVPSYHESFHGKALLRFEMDHSAGCVDCHKAHDVLSPSNPLAPTNPANLEATCSSCHTGAKMNFAMSGANHLRLKVKQSPILQIEHFFFHWLTLGTILFLLGGVALDLRRKVFAAHSVPHSGRIPGLLISLSFLAVVLALALAYIDQAVAATWTVGVAIGLMAMAFIAYAVGPKRPRVRAEKVYQRITVAQRVQHIMLAVSFTLLVLTGMPMRFASIEWVNNIYVLFGGLGGARIVHRVAAVVMIITWIWHTLYLLYRWKKAGWSLDSWTMLPNRKDIADFIQLSKYYLGLTHEEPRFDRFQFREKFDYFAVYWGMPVMVFSGLVLWFPVYFGNRLPEIGFAVAFIAHSDEAILAFLAIVTWHMYNVHFNPDAFPMSPTWYTGTKTQEEMEREHPLELERIESADIPEQDEQVLVDEPVMPPEPAPPEEEIPDPGDERAPE